MRPVHGVRRGLDLARALAISRTLERHLTWTRAEIEELQSEKLRALLAHAVKRSRFYRDLYAGIDVGREGALSRLPPLSRSALMENWDSIVTRPELKLDAAMLHLAGPRRKRSMGADIDS